jgi:hypothetical protein
MKESTMRPRPHEADKSQARRAERGIVAGYIHELSRRHDTARTPQPPVEAAAEASEGS